MPVSKRSARSENKRATSRQLSEQEIVAAALRLIQSIGIEQLSMRKLAAELGVTPMAIYYYVRDKEALFDLVVDAVLAAVPMPAPRPERWQQQMKAYALSAWRLVNAYPNFSRILFTRRTSKSGLALVRYGIEILLAGGFDERDAALAITTFHTYLYGAFSAVSAMSQLGREARRRTNARRKRPPSREGATGLELVGRELRELRLEDTLDFGVDAVLTGIAARARLKRNGKGR